jgi:cytochrome c oxidase cbb3-type subunit III
MIQRTQVGLILAALALAVALALALGTTAAAQRTAVRVAPAPSDPKAVFLEACGKCHPPQFVTATRRTKAQWEETINAMVTSRGATLTPDQYQTVLKYLVAEYGPMTSTQRRPGGGGAATSAHTPAPTPPQQTASGAAAGGRTSTPTAGAASAVGPRPQARGGAGPDDKQIVDPEAAQRGRKTYAAGCIQCHGTQARGTERGANLVRSLVVLHDRYGNQLGPFLHKGHPTQGSASSQSFTDAQITDLSHFLHERLNDTLRGAPGFTVQNVLTGDRQAGAAYFDGAGGCRQCHSPTGDLAGIGARYDPPTLQQRFLFPRPPGRGPRGGPAAGARARAGAAGAGAAGASPAGASAAGAGAAGAASAWKPVTVTVTTPSGETVTGVLEHLDDFNVSLRDDAGQYRSWKRAPGLTVVKHDPYAAHVAMLDTYTDKNIHDVVAYLESLK